MQSLVLKWNNYQCVKHEGYNYLRIRGNFVISEGGEFTTILVQSDDEGIGVLIAVPKVPISTEEGNFWESVKAAAASLKGGEQPKYKELWLPGFSYDSVCTDLASLFPATTDQMHVVKVCLRWIMKPKIGG